MATLNWESDGRRRRATLEPGASALIGRGLQDVQTRDGLVLIPITDAGVSRRHARVSAVGAGWIIEDLGSTNGTRVQRGGDEPVDVDGSFAMYSGDVVLVGQASIHFATEEATGVARPTQRAILRDPGLTIKQREVVMLLIRFIDSTGDAIEAKRQIVAALGISDKTVDGHLHQAAEAFGVERTDTRGGKRWQLLARAAREAGFG